MENKRTEISALGEFGLIEHLTEDCEIRNASTLLSIGDDAAVIDTFGKQMVVSTDMLVEGVHFDLTYMPLKHLGYKAVAVNLSDLYAMFATPTQITVSLAISNRFSVESLDELYDGIKLACQRYGIDIVGGDTTSSMSGLVISITAIGEVEENTFVNRSGAQLHDLICVSGDLGAAYMGLLVLEREKKIFLENPTVQPQLGQNTYILERFMKPEPKATIIKTLKQHAITPTSMIDISDGLSSELNHIAKQSACGVLIYEDKIPIHEQTRAQCEEFNIAATTAALNGGEDYELLFTVSANDFEKISAIQGISIIGHTVAQGEGLKLITNGDKKIDIPSQGWVGV
ncbi:MAG: thiamine-phosphate kinase [Chitinophagaceae bacterium]